MGISFGADRIYDVLTALDKFPASLSSSTKLLFALMDVTVLPYLIPVVRSLRETGVACEVYPDAGKLKKQFDYASRKAIPFISINGSEEAANGTINLKNLSTGDQRSFSKDDLRAMREFLGY